VFAQTATNFNCDDCSGQNHDFFGELDEGNIIVICWVMPCGPCQGPSLTSFNVVKSFSETNPDRVFLYLVDDYGDTKCGPLNGWVKDKGLSGSTVFSDASINMEDYGAFGMPKIAVVGGADHQIYYQAEFVVDANALQTAIADALIAVDVPKDIYVSEIAWLSPNPATDESTIYFDLKESMDVRITILNPLGQTVSIETHEKLTGGEHSILLNTSGLKSGVYTVNLSAGMINKSLQLQVSH